MPRERPDAEAIRTQLKDERARVEGSAPAESEAPEPEAAEQPAEAEAEAPEAPQEEEAPEADANGRPDVERERDEYLELARRTQADFENFRKRTTKDLAAAGARAKVGLLRELLPVVDNLERALASAEDADGALAEGVRLVHSELVGALARSGVEAIEPAGEEFDPNVHEALTTRSEDGAESGVVLEVVEKGYRLGDTVIRPARVVVSQ